MGGGLLGIYIAFKKSIKIWLFLFKLCVFCLLCVCACVAFFPLQTTHHSLKKPQHNLFFLEFKYKNTKKQNIKKKMKKRCYFSRNNFRCHQKICIDQSYFLCLFFYFRRVFIHAIKTKQRENALYILCHFWFFCKCDDTYHISMCRWMYISYQWGCIKRTFNGHWFVVYMCGCVRACTRVFVCVCVCVCLSHTYT